MTYEPLALKYRPRSFADMVGQEHVTEGLRAAIEGSRVAHAYLFCGPRGTGKTTTARILARCLNCEKGVTSEPCGTCDNCQAILDGASLDVLELDAASQRKVEDTEDWVATIHLVPAGRYKVYIVDEVHMFSRASFNLLLKTFEEPPPHVLFVLATTEPDKVPATVRGRCQRFDLRLVPHEVLVNRYRYICENEGLEAEPAALEVIARQAAGSVRDGITLLEQAISDDGRRVELTRVRALTGAVDRALLERAVDLMVNADAASVFALVSEVVQAGGDLRRYTEDLVGYLRGVVLAAAGADPRRLLDAVDDSSADAMTRHGTALGAEAAIGRLERLAEVSKEIDNEAAGRIRLEAALVRCCLPHVGHDIEHHAPAPQPVTAPAAAPTAPPKPVRQAPSATPRATPSPAPPAAESAPFSAEPEPPAPAPSTEPPSAAAVGPAADQWRDVVLSVGRVAQTLLDGSRVIGEDGPVLRVGVDEEFKVKRLADRRVEIDSAVQRIYGSGRRVQFEVSVPLPEPEVDEDDYEEVGEVLETAGISPIELVKQGFAADVIEEYKGE